MHELTRAESVNVDLRKFRFDVRKQIEIPLHRKFRMMPALHQNLRAAERDGFLNFFIHLVVRDDVGVIVFLDAIERAEFAIDVADVRVIDVAINDVGDDFVPAPIERGFLRQLPASIRQRAEFFQRQMIKSQRFSGINALSVPNFLQQLVQ